MNKKRSLTLALLALSLGLAACGGKPGDTTRRSHSSTPNSGGQVTGELADGVFDYTAADQDTKTDILAHLEGYALRNHLAGIPLYDDASYEQFSQRITLPTTTYITNYGFGTFHGDLDASGKMYTGAIDEPVSEWKSYFHSYTTSDTGTFNYWDSTGADVADRSGMITSSYFDVDMNEAKNDYVWKAGLSMTDAPIMLRRTDNADGTHSFTEVTDSSIVANSSSKYWRVKLHTGAGYTYAVPSTSKYYSTYNGREIALEDYITPYWAMLSGRLSRWSGLSTDASGFEGVLSYVNSGSSSRAPFGVKGETGGSTTNLGIQINYDENAIDFAFITPKTQSGAMLNLASGLYSPIPYDFLTAIGGAKNFGVRDGADATVTNNTTRNLDNIIVCGPYIPVYWQTNKSLVYKKNANYYNAADYHFDGVTEDVFTGTNADVTAYNAFLANKLDEVSIPSSQITNHKNDPHVYRTEGSTIIKMNVNSCTDEEWDYYFGENGTIKKHAKTARWDVKPIMSNDDFLNGFFYAVDRETLAAQSGRNSALGYLSNAYMIDPNGKVPYRESEKGKAVIGQYTEAAGNEYAYSPALAGELFSRAINTLLSQGSDVLNDGATITLTCYYRYQDTIDNIGKYLKNSVETAFNTCQAAKDHKITLNLDLKVAGSNYTDCYNKMDEGIYDFAEGAISGNVLDPLNFMNTICTDRLAQGFCLNWGTITAKVDANDPLEYAGKVWAYDALWSAANSMTIVEKGVASTMGANAAVVDEVPFPSAPDYVVNGIDEESWAGDSRYVSVVASYPPLTDKEGNSIWHFEYNDSHNAAILCSESTTFQSGYYLQSSDAEWVDYTEEGYGFIRLRILKSAIQDIAQQCSTSLGTDINYFAVQFSFSYTYTNSQGIEMEKINIIEATGSLSDFSGLTPVTK